MGNHAASRVVLGAARLPSPSALHILAVTSSLLVRAEVDALCAWVEDGGHLIWHGLAGDYFAPGSCTGKLLGGVFLAGSLKPGLESRLSVAGTVFAFDSWLGPAGAGPLLRISGGAAPPTMHWMSDDGTALLAVYNRIGKGSVFAAVPAVEQMPLALAGRPRLRDAWATWYSFALSLLSGGDSGGAVATTASVTQDLPGALSPNVMTSTRAGQGYTAKDLVKGGDPPRIIGRAAACTKAVAVYGGSTIAHQALVDNGCSVTLLAANITEPLPPGLDIVFVASHAKTLLPDQDVLFDWLHESPGRCIIWSGCEWSSFSTRLYTNVGAAAIDFRSPQPSNFSAFGQQWVMNAFLGNVHVEFDPAAPQQPQWGRATVLARDDRGLATLLRHQPAPGHTVVLATPAVELAKLPPAQLKVWYTGVMTLC